MQPDIVREISIIETAIAWIGIFPLRNGLVEDVTGTPPSLVEPASPLLLVRDDGDLAGAEVPHAPRRELHREHGEPPGPVAHLDDDADGGGEAHVLVLARELAAVLVPQVQLK